MDIKELREKINQIDLEMIPLFEKRMEVARLIALYKKANNLAIFDSIREEEIINNNASLIKNEELRIYYINFLKSLIKESKKYQSQVINDKETISINAINSYDIVIKNDVLKNIKDYLSLEGKILLISDNGIPKEYISTFLNAYPNALSYIFEKGEENKSIKTYQEIMFFLSENGFSRKDNIVALGGGLTSDLAGYVASTYMRGMNFYIISTTLLADVDASIGGKVAINFNNVKNLVGSFYEPKKVIIDPTLLKSLDDRLFFEGLVEAIKMAMTFDKDLFEFIEKLSNREEVEKHISEIIYRSLLIKKDVVEKDVKEENLRKTLNFGHTVGHALEMLYQGSKYHGECVAIGMTYFTNKDNRDRLINLFNKFNIPYEDNFAIEDIMHILIKDKKKNNDDSITICYVDEIGKYELRKLSFNEIKEMIRRRKDEK